MNVAADLAVKGRWSIVVYRMSQYWRGPNGGQLDMQRFFQLLISAEAPADEVILFNNNREIEKQWKRKM